MKREDLLGKHLSIAACVELLEVFVNEEEVYNIGLEHINDILLSDYLNKEFTLVCNGFNPNKWQLKTCELDIVINESLSTQLMVLMVVSNIDYIRLTWGGADFIEFFPIDIFTKIVELQKDFDAAAILHNGFMMIEKSNEITEYCDILAEKYNDDSYIELAFEYIDMIELVQTLEIQDILLTELLSVDDIDYDSTMILFKDYERNLDILENHYPGSPYVCNFPKIVRKINELTINYITSNSDEFDDIQVVTKSDMKERFSNIYYDEDDSDDMYNMLLLLTVDDDDLGDLSDIDWNTVLSYKKFMHEDEKIF